VIKIVAGVMTKTVVIQVKKGVLGLMINATQIVESPPAVVL
jgi:hypothetical protein